MKQNSVNGETGSPNVIYFRERRGDQFSLPYEILKYCSSVFFCSCLLIISWFLRKRLAIKRISIICENTIDLLCVIKFYLKSKSQVF